jgi:TonB family protein
VYPAAALRERIRGVVVLRAVVSETGSTMRVTVVKGVRPDIDAAAVSAALQWWFEPARKDGRAVRTFATIRFAFEGVQFARTPLLLEPGASPPTATPTPAPRTAEPPGDVRDRRSDAAS